MVCTRPGMHVLRLRRNRPDALLYILYNTTFSTSSKTNLQHSKDVPTLIFYFWTFTRSYDFMYFDLFCMFCLSTKTPRHPMAYFYNWTFSIGTKTNSHHSKEIPCDSHLFTSYYYQALRGLYLTWCARFDFSTKTPRQPLVYSVTERFQSVRTRTHTIAKTPPFIIFTFVSNVRVYVFVLLLLFSFQYENAPTPSHHNEEAPTHIFYFSIIPNP